METPRLLIYILSLKLSLLGPAIVLAQEEKPVAPPKSAELPQAFAKFTASDVLKKIFDAYDPASGRVATSLDEDGKPALVRINEAKLWKAQGQKHLVVIVELAADDYQFEGGLCGGCGTYAILAVLKETRGALVLVAKQRASSSTAISEEGDNNPADPYGAMFYAGHDELFLDLAPYKLNARETLIGARISSMWLPAHLYSTALYLYRVEGQDLKEVFSELVVDRTYPDALSGRRGKGKAVLKTVSTLRSTPSRQRFYGLRINKTLFSCSDSSDDWDCDSKDETVRQVGSEIELWRFDGVRFNPVADPPKTEK